MERTMSIEEKIRRAEEIYYRRREQDPLVRECEKIKKENKKDIKLFKKLIKQIVLCLIVYFIFYIIINNNYLFSEDFRNKVKDILAQNINFSQVYSNITNKVNDIYNQIKLDKTAEIKEEQNTEQEKINEHQEMQQTEEDKTEEDKTKEEIQNNNENIGGAEELITNQELPLSEVVESSKDKTENLTQMEQDANYIKSTISFIKPLNGTISSMFGIRNPTTSTVPKNHTGTDIATETGTEIVSATDGTIILASNKGDYGKHLKVQINDVIIVYAHCNKLYVKEGDIIKQGQKIAEVGSTGNTTGPHLHFEVRYQGRYVDPQLILEL